MSIQPIIPYADYHSGEFSLGIDRPGSNAVALFDGYVWLLGHNAGDSDSDNDMWQTTFKLDNDFVKKIADKDNWTNNKVSPLHVPHGMSPWRHCGADVAVAGTKPGLYLFWVNNNGGLLLASCCPPGSGGNPNWGHAMTLTHGDGITEIKPGGDVAATAFGDDTFLVAVAFDNQGIGVYAFNTGDINAVQNNNWGTRSHLFLTIAQLQGEIDKVAPGMEIENVGPNITIAWSSGLEKSTSATALPPTPSFYATVFVKASIKGKRGQISLPLVMFLDETANLGSYFFLNPFIGVTEAPLQVVRDSAGRLLSFSTWGDSKKLACYLYAINAVL